MNSDMIVKIVSALGGVPKNVGIEGIYEEVVEDFEVVGSSGEEKTNHVDRSIWTTIGEFLDVEISWS